MSNLLPILKNIYPHDYHSIQHALAESFHHGRLDSFFPKDWHKSIQLYVTYPDAFHDQNNESGLDQLTAKLDYIKNLGCNAIHVLPFLASPQIDAGFDISEYYIIRDDLGGNKAFEMFLSEARKRGLAVFMDLVLNHVSEEHRWFAQAVSGDRFYRSFFETSWNKPELVKRFSNETGEWATYQTSSGEKDFRIIFPDHCGEIPHWRQAEDGFWYYHTFYPQQIDVNWNNHHVFITFAKTLIYWAKKGLSFRLDAIPFVGKDVLSGNIETTEKTHQIVQALHSLVKTVSPDSVFLVEANQPISKMKSYFGVEATQFRPQVIESELAYNFPLMNSLWTALVTNNPSDLGECLGQTGQVPEWAAWVTFLRNHDELSLEYAPVEQKQLIYDSLIKHGLPFRGSHDVAGRTASFLQNNKDEIGFAHFALFSLPGNPAIIYGDEIGKLNDIEFMKHQTVYKSERLDEKNVVDDTRDINRGFLDDNQIENPSSQEIFDLISKIFRHRLTKAKIFNGDFSYQIIDQSILRVDYNSLIVILNFSTESKELDITENLSEVIFSFSKASVSESKIFLPKRSGLWLKTN